MVMSPEKLNEIIRKGEGIDVEFKSAKKGFPENLYETVCAFLNRNGGHLFLGVDDNKNIVGIEPVKIQNYINKISNGKQPELLEGENIFKITIPIYETRHYDVGGINTVMNDVLKSLSKTIQSNTEIKKKDIFIILNDRAVRTIERPTKTLVSMG